LTYAAYNADTLYPQNDAMLQVWFQNARAKHRRAMLKHGLSEQQEQPQHQPHSRQLYQHQSQHHHHQQQQGNLNASGASLLQSTNASVTHQLAVNPIDDRITDFSLYENALSDYGCITK